MYPKLPFSKENFINFKEHFALTPNDLNIINQIIKPMNKLGFAVLFKTFQFLGYFPQQKNHIPVFIVEYIASFLELSPKIFQKYKWKNRSFEYHVGIIRKQTDFKYYDSKRFTELKSYVLDQKSIFPSRKNISSLLLKHFREIKLELPFEKEYRRLVNSLRKTYYNHFYGIIFNELSQDSIVKMKNCLNIKGKEDGGYAQLKSPAGKSGLKTILKEIEKLNYIKDFEIKEELFSDYHPKLLEQLYRRCRSKDAAKMKNHSDELCCSLMAVYFNIRKMEITDGIMKTFLELIRRIEKRSDKFIEKEVKQSIKKNYNKQLILRKLTLAITANPEGTIEDVILSKVNLETLIHLANEFKEKAQLSYTKYKANTMKRKYTRFYRRMMKPILDTLDFQANNPKWDNLLNGVELIHKYLNTNHVYYPENEEVPIELLSKKWRDVAIEEDDKGLKIKKHYFELCVLEKLERTLKCKEVFVEGSFQYQNPEKDLPKEWQEKRLGYYDRLNLPIEAKDFIIPLQEQMKSCLENANNYFAIDRDDDVYIFYPAGGKRGYFRVPKIKKRESRPILKEIHKLVHNKWGIIDLLDILVEADRYVNFSRFFYSSGQREILKEEQIRERLLLCLFSLGTNIGLKRVHKAAKPNCSYKDLIYFKNHYLNLDSLREVIVALTNKILKVRNSLIWGETTTCACDGKQFGSWDQNLMANSNPHYRDPGIMVYWHLDTNATCIHSQIKDCNSSEVAAMIEGLVRHATDMVIEANLVDSRGQSEIAFAFCHFLGINLMPRLKRIKHQTLYLPSKELKEELVNLKGVLNRPIRWNLIIEQYDEMVKYVSAILENPDSTESILRRFTSYNQTHPTYKAFLELGRACKTIFLCNYLTIKEQRVEIHEGLNIVESWNSVNNFLCFGNKGEFQSNDPYTQEIIVLCLHLLQNSMILTNTVMIDKVISENNLLDVLTDEDRNSLNPLGTENINPYGNFNLILIGSPLLEAA